MGILDSIRGAIGETEEEDGEEPVYVCRDCGEVIPAEKERCDTCGGRKTKMES